MLTSEQARKILPRIFTAAGDRAAKLMQGKDDELCEILIEAFDDAYTDADWDYCWAFVEAARIKRLSPDESRRSQIDRALARVRAAEQKERRNET